jgi:hypothetical protein
MRARYAGFADASDSSPGGDLEHDAGALRLPALRIAVHAVRVSRRAATLTLARILYGAAGVYLPSQALNRLTLERRG